MSRQNLDLRTSIQIVRRQKKLFGGVAALGFLVGAVYAFLTPPALSSTALVVIGSNPASLNQQANSSANGIDTSLATQIVIAGSSPVLAGALPHVSPPGESLLALSGRISVAAVGNSDILSFTATGKTLDQAEETANAVANSYVAYVGTSTSTAVQVSARVLEAATTATGTQLPKHIGIYAILGALAGALVGFVMCLARSRGDRRLTRRNDIANSIAVPVLVSIPVERPADPPSWARLLDEYEPDAVNAYGLSKLLRQFGRRLRRHKRERAVAHGIVSQPPTRPRSRLARNSPPSPRHMGSRRLSCLGRSRTGMSLPPCIPCARPGGRRPRDTGSRYGSWSRRTARSDRCLRR